MLLDEDEGGGEEGAGAPATRGVGTRYDSPKKKRVKQETGNNAGKQDNKQDNKKIKIILPR
jgi:hypothetical protein